MAKVADLAEWNRKKNSIKKPHSDEYYTELRRLKDYMDKVHDLAKINKEEQ